MITFIKKNKIFIVTAVVAAFILAAAFFLGGNSTDTKSDTSDFIVQEASQEISNTVITENITSHTENISHKVNETTKPQIKNTEPVKSAESTYNSSFVPSSTQSEKVKYNTDAVPQGKPKPVEPQEQEIEKDIELYCTISISCKTILSNLSDFDIDKLELLPADGWILKQKKVKFNSGESAYNVLERVCRENKIHMEASFTPVYNTAYIEGINNIYEFDCGEGSGWKFKVNDWFPNYGCSRYQLNNGDTIEFLYTCNFGDDL